MRFIKCLMPDSGYQIPDQGIARAAQALAPRVALSIQLRAKIIVFNLNPEFLHPVSYCHLGTRIRHPVPGHLDPQQPLNPQLRDRYIAPETPRNIFTGIPGTLVNRALIDEIVSIAVVTVFVRIFIRLAEYISRR